MLNVKHVIEVKGSGLCLALPALHCFTGCDTISAFVRKGKRTPLKALEKFPDFVEVFCGLGKNLTCSDTLLDDLEWFVCCMYGKAQYTSVNKLRYALFSQKYQGTSGQVLTAFDGIDWSLLPPCRASLEMHAHRANYHAFIWCHAHEQFPDVPGPEGHGWKLDEEGAIDYGRTSGFIAPQELIDILNVEPNETSEEEEEGNDDLATEADYVIDVTRMNLMKMTDL